MLSTTAPITAVIAATAASIAAAQPVLYASGQLLIPGDPDIPPGQPGHDDTRENYIYSINPLSGVATPVSPVTSGLPAALGAASNGVLYGFSSGQLVIVDPITGTQADVGPDSGLSSTAFDITDGGVGYIVPFDALFNTQQIHAVDLGSGTVTPIGSASAIGDAIDTARSLPLGTAEPFAISLGSVGATLYAVDLDTDSLVAIESSTGDASVVGQIGAVGAANGGAYSGFAALTGIDENADGSFDALIGVVNFFNDGSGTQRLGGVARFDLSSGDWSLVGTNPGIIFFGLGSVPGSGRLCAADLAAPLGTADIFDIITFFDLFSEQDTRADFRPDNAFDIFDIIEFFEVFSTC